MLKLFALQLVEDNLLGEHSARWRTDRLNALKLFALQFVEDDLLGEPSARWRTDRLNALKLFALQLYLPVAERIFAS